MIFSEKIESLRPTAAEVGKAFRVDDAVGRYVVYLKNSFPKDFSLDGMKIVLDCAHGAAYKVAPTVLWELGADVIPLGVAPDGFNINRECGALATAAMRRKVVEESAHLGLALDGDRRDACDRVPTAAHRQRGERGGDHAGRVAHREADAALAPVHCQDAHDGRI